MSKRLAAEDPPFAALIMAALRKADSHNAELLRRAYPEVCAEMQLRYDATGGKLPGDVEPGDAEHRWVASSTVDTGHQPPRRLWVCVCGEEMWATDNPPRWDPDTPPRTHE
jgi:hypothetical protein